MRKLKLFFFGLLSVILQLGCVKEITDEQLEGTWQITSINEGNVPYQYCFIQFSGGRYNVFWWNGNRFLFCPSRDGAYRHFDDILFLREDYVSYQIDFVDPPIYFGFLSKAANSKVRFTSLRAAKVKNITFNPNDSTVTIKDDQFPVYPTENDLFPN